MKIAQKYVEGLKRTYYELGGEKQWQFLEQTSHGAAAEDIEKLRAMYPDIPESLVQLLQIVDGTYWRKYGENTVHQLFLGSDLEGFPYFLLSAQQIMQTKDNFKVWGDELIYREYDDIPVDDGITDNFEQLCWLHFSDCMNNGGSSQLFIDFTPSAKGKKGQIVRYLHDPDELVVIVDSFDSYLEMLMENQYDFIDEEDIEEWEEC